MAIDITEIPEFYRPYFNPATEESVLELLDSSARQFHELIDPIDDAKAAYKYAQDKWSIKDLIQHIIDSERVFAYRALRFARKDNTPLEGFEQNDYAEAAFADLRSKSDLVEEFDSIRQSTIALFKSFDDKDYDAVGKASGFEFSVRNMGYMISGHLIHHLKIIRERYL